MPLLKWFKRRKEPEPEQPPSLQPLRRELEALPQRPASRRHPRQWLFRLKRLADFIGHTRPTAARFFRQVNPYPKPFRHIRFATEDGVTIAAWYGPPQADDSTAEAAAQEEAPGEGDGRPPADGAADPGTRRTNGRAQPPRDGTSAQAGTDGPAATRAGPATADADGPDPERQRHRPPFGLVLVPGMFSTKDDTIHKRRALRVWREWKVPVLVIDMRAFGESTGIATAGWKEAFDVHAAARELKKRSGARRVGVLAESMGGAAALNALAHDSQTGTDAMDGGVLTFSAFVDAHDAISYISHAPPRDDPFHIPFRSFQRLLHYKSMGGYERFDEYLTDVARVNGLESLEELTRLANPKWKVSLMRQPTLLVHASDDPVVPVRHARRMERYAREQLHIQTIVVGWGGHTGFEAMDPWWFWEVASRFFNHVNGLDLPNPEDA